MPRLQVFFYCCVLAVLVSPILAQEKFDPAARVAAIAPFIEEKTVAIAHTQLSRLDLDAAVPADLPAIPGVPPSVVNQQKKAMKEIPEKARALMAAGVDDVYFLVSLHGVDAGKEPASIAVFVAKDGSDPQKVAEIVTFEGQQKPLVKGQCVVLGGPGFDKYVNGIQSVERPEFVSAFKLAGRTDIQVVLVPSEMIRSFPVDMPTLPKEVSGLLSTLQKKLDYAAFTMNANPNLAFGLFGKMSDAESADQIREGIAGGLALLKQNPFVPAMVPKFDELAKFATPTVVDTQWKILFSEKNGGTQVVKETVENLMKFLAAAGGPPGAAPPDDK